MSVTARSASKSWALGLCRAAAASSPPADEPVGERATVTQTYTEWWQQLDQRVYQCISLWIGQWWEPQHHTLIDALGQCLAEERQYQRTAIEKIRDRITEIEKINSVEERFAELVRRSELPLLERIEELQCQIDDQKKGC